MNKKYIVKSSKKEKEEDIGFKEMNTRTQIKVLKDEIDNMKERRERAKKLYRDNDFRRTMLEERVKRLEEVVKEELGIDLHETFVDDFPLILERERNDRRKESN
jgi:hypothetical protein